MVHGVTFTTPCKKLCFHSISFPNEWGVGRVTLWPITGQVPSYGFHSISFPNEWGVQSMQPLKHYAPIQFPFN